jgi:hypothetical protein
VAAEDGKMAQIVTVHVSASIAAAYGNA